MLSDSETWRVIPCTYGGYEASSHGRIRSVARRVRFKSQKGGWFHKPNPSRVLASQEINSGYLVVNLSVRGRRIPATVHRLVAAAFIGPRPRGHDICHNNRDKKDNRPENLRYDTRRGNLADRVAHGTSYLGITNWSTLDPAKARAIRASKEAPTALAAQYGVTAHTIRRVLRRELWKYC